MRAASFLGWPRRGAMSALFRAVDCLTGGLSAPGGRLDRPAAGRRPGLIPWVAPA